LGRYDEKADAIAAYVKKSQELGIENKYLNLVV
jgi:hypothetical protein